MRLTFRAKLLWTVGLAAALPAGVLVALGQPVLSWPAAALMLLAAAGVGLAAWRLAEGMRRGLGDAVVAARRLAAGDWQKSVPARGSDEVRALAAELERVRGHLAAQRAGPAAKPGGAMEDRAADLARRIQELAIFRVLGVAAARPEEQRAILDQALVELIKYLGVEAAALYLGGSDGRAAEIAAQAGHTSGSLKRMARLRLDDVLAAALGREDGLFILEDLSGDEGSDARDLRPEVDVLRSEGFQALAAMPVAVSGRALGILMVTARVPREFGPRDRQFLQSLGPQIGMVLAHSAFARETERRAARLQALARLSRSIAVSSSPQEVWYLTVVTAAQLLDLAYVRVWLRGPAGGGLQAGPWHEAPGQATRDEGAAAPAGRWAEASPAGEPTPEEALAALVASAEEGAFIPRIAADPRCQDPAWWTARGAASVAAVPLTVGDRRLGALVAVPRGPAAFTPEDRELLGLLADQAAAACENASIPQERAAAAAQTMGGLESGETQFEGAVGRILTAIGRAADLAGAGAALESGAQEALGVGMARAVLMDGVGMLRVHSRGEAPPLAVPANHPASLAARAVHEGTMQAWGGSGPCWEAEKGLVSWAGAAVPLLVEEEGPAGPAGVSAVGCLLIGSAAAGREIGVDVLARAERLAHEAAPSIRRLRDLESARATRGRLEALLRLDSVLVETAGIEAAMEAIADGARRILAAEAVVVFRLGAGPDGAGRVLRQVAGTAPLFAGAELDGQTGLVAAALGARTPQALGSAPDQGNPDGTTLEALAARAGFRGLAVMPIAHRSVCRGLLAVCRTDAMPFDEPQAELLAALAARAGAVWDDREQREDLEAHASRSAMINELVQAASATRDLDRLADLLIARLRHLLGCDGATLAFDESERGMVRFARDLVAGPAGAGFSVPAAETSVPMAMALQEPVVIPDLDASLLALHRRWAGAGFRSLAEVPLVAEGRSCGALLVANRAPGGIPPERVELLTMLAAAVGPVVANARRLAELELSSRDFKVAQEHLADTEDLRAAGQVATTMGQEVGDRLMDILVRAQEALHQAQDPGQRDLLRQIEKAAEAGVETMRRLTRMTRPHRVDGAARSVDLAEVARQACEMTRTRWRDEARARGITIALVPDLRPVPGVQGDPVALRVVLMTAILNASNALPRGGTITVRTRPQARAGVPGVLVEVADTGVGMPEALRAKVLEPAVGGAGAGLGLASARAEVERHGGHMAIESALGRGTTVAFWVPTGDIAPVAWTPTA